MTTLLTAAASATHVTIGTTITGGVAWLEPAAAASYNTMRAAGMPAGGITSAGRSSAEQSSLYQAYLAGKGNQAAKPGTSAHEAGDALDMNVASRAHQWLLTNGGKYGWTRTVKAEAWHWQYGGASSSSSSSSSPLGAVGNVVSDVWAGVKSIGSGLAKGATDPLGVGDAVNGLQTIGLRLLFITAGAGLVILGLARVVATSSAGQKTQALVDEKLSTITGGQA